MRADLSSSLRRPLRAEKPRRVAGVHSGRDQAIHRAPPRVNAGEKLRRLAGVKIHHPAKVEGWSSSGQWGPKLSFPVRSMSLLSRPDLASPGPRRAA
jgi:hypothetical protein